MRPNSTNCLNIRAMSTLRSVFPNGSSITTCTGLTPPTGEKRPLKSYMKNLKAKLMDLEVRSNNDLKYRRNLCQAIFGLLQRFLRRHPHNIAEKTEVMVEHFHAVTRHKIGGRAKAMVVTSSRLEAVRYKQRFDRYIREKQYAIKTLVAFSGEVPDDQLPNESYTEEEMNLGIREKELPEKFATPEYQVLLVAEKYQTVQHNIAGCDTMLLGETIRLLTPSSHLGGFAPRRSPGQILLAELLCHYGPRIPCDRRVVQIAMLDLNPFYPLYEGAF